jgi:hypothetical protein
MSSCKGCTIERRVCIIVVSNRMKECPCRLCLIKPMCKKSCIEEQVLEEACYKEHCCIKYPKQKNNVRKNEGRLF